MNTKKKITPLSDNRIKYRRSSLRSNLTCISNLTDSANDNASANKAKYIGHLHSDSNEIHSRLPQGNLLHRINRHDATLRKSCERLTTAILMKTKRIFPEQSDLSVKTSDIFNDRGVHGKYRKRRLFEESSNNRLLTDEHPNNNNVSSNTFNNFIISSGTATRGTDNFNRFNDKSLSNTSVHEDTFTATPIASSTMINENNDVSCAEDDAQFALLKGLPSVSKTDTKPCATSMEVTNVCEGFVLCDKPTPSLKRVKKGTSLVEQRNDETFQRRVSGNETETTNTEKTSLNVNTSVDSISKRKDNEHDDRESINTVRTSLRMNTSLNISRTMQQTTHGNESSIDAENATSNVTRSDNSFHQKNIKETKKLDTNEQSRIEATPYPMYRSVMLRSQFRQNAPSRSSRHRDESIKDSNIENVAKKPYKKKLMPLNEHSQISLSPAENHYSPPRYLPFRRKLIRGKSNGKIIKNEQNERNKKKGKNVKKIVSKRIVVKKIVDQEILNRLQENTENLDKSPIDTQLSNRNSSNDFRSFEGSSATKRYKSKKKRTLRISIVTTGLSNDDKSIVGSVVKTLGSARIESNVTKRTTHVVTTGLRTINLLHAIIRGCWILGLEWVLKSLENGAWLNPRQYEMQHFSSAVLENRRDRQLFGSSYVPELFAACGYIHIENNTTPPCNVLKDLVKTAGGCITENPRTAKVVIGRDGLKETWLFDCITSGELQPYDRYVRS